MSFQPNQSDLTSTATAPSEMLTVSITRAPRKANAAAGTVAAAKESSDAALAEQLCESATKYASRRTIDDYKKACEYYQPAANLGNAKAQCMLGCHYEFGQGVERNLNKAFYYYQLAANQGFPAVWYRLGRCYDNGWGVAENAEKAFYYFKLAAKQGDAQAQFKVGWFYALGRGVVGDIILAFHYYLLAAKQGNAEAQKELTKLKKNFTAENYYELGAIYYDGDGVPKDRYQANEFFKIAAKEGVFTKGHAEAQYELACSYQAGDGIEQDHKKAFEFFKLAAEQGDAEAQNKVGYCYSKGHGVPRNKKKAFHYYELSANRKSAYGQNAVGCFYFKGEVVTQNFKKAVEYFQLSAQQKCSTAQSNLGECYEYGFGVPQNNNKALELYQLAAEQNEVNALITLGILFSVGKGVIKDSKKGLEFWERAGKIGLKYELECVEEGTSWGQYVIARCYEFGAVLEKDLQKAKDLYEKSAAQQEPAAQINLERFRRENPKLFIPADFFESTSNTKAVNASVVVQSASTASIGQSANRAIVSAASLVNDKTNILSKTSASATSTPKNQGQNALKKPASAPGPGEPSSISESTVVTKSVTADNSARTQDRVTVGISGTVYHLSGGVPRTVSATADSLTLNTKNVKNIQNTENVKNVKAAAENEPLVVTALRQNDSKFPEQNTRTRSTASATKTVTLSAVALSNAPGSDLVSVTTAETTVSGVITANHSAQRITAPSLTEEQLRYINALKATGIDPKLLNSTLSDLQQALKSTQEMELYCQWIKTLVPKFSQIEGMLNIRELSLQTDAKIKEEQDFINRNTKLKTYQRRLQQELCRFITCYYLAPAGILKLEDNMKDAVISAIGSVPVVGSFLKPFSAILSYANKKYRFKQMNRLAELFTDPRQIADVCCQVSHQVTLAKKEDIQKQVAVEYKGWKKIAGLLAEAKAILDQHWKDLKFADATGVALTPEDKLAILDAAYLLQQILSGDAKINKDYENEQVFVEQFIAILTDKSFQQNSEESSQKNSQKNSQENVQDSSTKNVQYISQKSEKNNCPNGMSIVTQQISSAPTTPIMIGIQGRAASLESPKLPEIPQSPKTEGEAHSPLSPTLEEFNKLQQQLQSLTKQAKAKEKAEKIEKEQERRKEELHQKELADLKRKLEDLSAGVSIDGGNSAQVFAVPLAKAGNRNSEESLFYEVSEVRDEVSHHRREILHLKSTLNEQLQVAKLQDESEKQKRLKSKKNDSCGVM